MFHGPNSVIHITYPSFQDKFIHFKIVKAFFIYPEYIEWVLLISYL